MHPVHHIQTVPQSLWVLGSMLNHCLGSDQCSHMHNRQSAHVTSATEHDQIVRTYVTQSRTYPRDRRSLYVSLSAEHDGIVHTHVTQSLTYPRSVPALGNLGGKPQPMDIIFSLFPFNLTMDFPLSSTRSINIYKNCEG